MSEVSCAVYGSRRIVWGSGVLEDCGRHLNRRREDGSRSGADIKRAMRTQREGRLDFGRTGYTICEMEMSVLARHSSQPVAVLIDEINATTYQRQLCAVCGNFLSSMKGI